MLTEQSMSAWVKAGNWANLKRAAHNPPAQEVQQLYEELRAINNNINGRAPDKRFGTKEELEAKAKILALIAGPLRNTGDRWRNVAPEIDYDVPKDPPADPPHPTNYANGKYDATKLNEYYLKVARLLVKADASIGKVKTCMADFEPVKSDPNEPEKPYDPTAKFNLK